MTDKPIEIRRSPHLPECGWCEDATPEKVVRVDVIIKPVNLDNEFLTKEQLEIELGRLFGRSVSATIIDYEERQVDWHDCHPLNFARITNEEFLEEWNKMKSWKD